MKVKIKIERLLMKISDMEQEVFELQKSLSDSSEEYMEAAQPVVNRGAMLNDS